MHIEELIASVKPIDAEIISEAQQRFDKLIKPVGSLAKLETMTSRYAAIVGSAAKENVVRPQPRLLLLFGAMSESSRIEKALRGKLPVVVAARQVDAQTCPILVTESGTDELLEEGAMLTAEFAGDTGAEVLLLGALSPAPRRSAWEEALEESDGRAFLNRLNHPVVTALTGAILQGASRRLPLILDGACVCLAAYAAKLLAPFSLQYCFPGHLSTEPGLQELHKRLEFSAPLKLNLPDSSGVGACACLSLFDAGIMAYTEMETFEEAGVHDEEEMYSFKVQESRKKQMEKI